MSNPDHLEAVPPATDAPPPESKSGKARISFALGLWSFFVSILTGVPAIILGLLSLREIRQSGGRLQGKKLAVAGIILGLLGSLASGSLMMYGVARVQRAVLKTGMG
jgi:hypothetical protein